MTPVDVSVIIPAIDEAANLPAAIQSALANGAGEVIVCDGGSRDATRQLAQQAGAKVIESERGRGTQLRQGAQFASGAMLLFLHADNRLDDGCLNELCRCVRLRGTAEQGQCAGSETTVGSPPSLLLWGGFRQRIDATALGFRLLEWGNASRIRYRGMPFGDQAMFVTRQLYDQVGGFQPLPLLEDVVLAQSLRRICWPILVDHTVQVDARRWQKRGIVRQTLRNWGIQLAHWSGVSESRLASWYR
ncbi:glycosyltransferase family 2 protein [Stieleria sp. TO1_6]|uniref:TIGR04283 family arsenosugar biosynthesis glycosyltransferase n=1 Tax=Stieleria tagensis TaxID=2956795 RepID=UPI00209BA321|nr:glycosyltransferase family 2 protein [Stieleria tagensis]MCO8124855.1 glycosyltransferase family 2 protein [Stieleria tagensis]